jgi:hypothetical protein
MRGLSKSVWVTMLATILGGIWTIGFVWAQEQNQRGDDIFVSEPPAETPAPDGYGEALDIAAPPMNMPVDDHGRRIWTNIGSSIRQAAEAVRDANDDEAKAAAEKALDDLLSRYFDVDMARRESELTKIEERLIKLRDLHNRRRAKKQEILELQTKVALNEAEGLGFYDGQTPGPWNASPGLLNADWNSGTLPPVTEAVTADPFASGSMTIRTYPNASENNPTPSQNIPSTGAVIIPEIAQPAE